DKQSISSPFPKNTFASELLRPSSISTRLDSRSSQRRCDRCGRLFGRPYRNDLEVHQVSPVLSPLLQQDLVVSFHHLETSTELEIDPACDVPDAIWRHPASIPEAAVHLRHFPWPETLYHHEYR